MKRWISILGALLVAQLVLALGLSLSGTDYGAFEPQEKLLTFDPKAVDRLVISDSEQSLTLQKGEAGWELPDAGSFPAEPGAVDRLLERLAGFEKGWPVASSDSALRRFEVADDQFQRKLVLYAGERTLGELYVGSSPGFRKVHARPADEDRVFAVPFAAWEASPKPDDWIEKNRLALDSGTLTGVKMPGFTLQKQGDAWTLDGLEAGETLDQGAVDKLLSQLAGLRIESLLGSEPKPEYRQDQPVLEIRVTRKDGSTLGYRFSKPEEGESYRLKRSDLGYYFVLAGFSVKPLLETDRAALIAAPAAGGETEAAAGGETEAAVAAEPGEKAQ